MFRLSILIAICTFLSLKLYAAPTEVIVTDIRDNTGGEYSVSELQEGGKFFHDRNYTMTHIPEKYLGLTQIQTSADCPGGIEYRLSFIIDRPAYVYMAWDSRHKSPEDREQNPEDWFTDAYVNTGEILILDDPHPPVEYLIYEPVEGVEGKIELFGIEEISRDDPVNMWTIFLEETVVSVNPTGNLVTTWGNIKERSK